jgi:hypothetical protein
MAQNVLHQVRHLKIFALIFLSIFVTANAHAVVTISSVTNDSNHSSLTEETPTIYGGTAGDINATNGSVDPLPCASRNNVDVCNSCANNGLAADARLTACNPVRIYPNAQITITFKSDKVGGRPVLWNANTTPDPLTTVTTPAKVDKGGTASITLNWSVICGAMETNPDVGCGLEGTGKLKLGIDENDNGVLDTGDDSKIINFVVSAGAGTAVSTVTPCRGVDPTGIGMCNFDVTPGDEKVKVQDLVSDSAFPKSQPVPFKNVLFFLSTDPTLKFDAINPTSDYFPLAIDQGTTDTTDTSTSGTLDSDLITGLTNETQYYFKLALQDQAMNIGYWTPTADDFDCFATTPINTPPCHSAVPGAVVGILSKDVNCFVATAAYGSSMEKHVALLREFRNEFLVPSKLGKKFIFTYYKYGPYAARFIHDSEPLRFAARVVLTPFVGFAWIAVHFGIFAALAFLIIILAFPVLLLRRREHRSSRINE